MVFALERGLLNGQQRGRSWKNLRSQARIAFQVGWLQYRHSCKQECGYAVYRSHTDELRKKTRSSSSSVFRESSSPRCVSVGVGKRQLAQQAQTRGSPHSFGSNILLISRDHPHYSLLHTVVLYTTILTNEALAVAVCSGRTLQRHGKATNLNQLEP